MIKRNIVSRNAKFFYIYYIYRPQTKLRKGNKVMCRSFCPLGGGVVYLSIYLGREGCVSQHVLGWGAPQHALGQGGVDRRVLTGACGQGCVDRACGQGVWTRVCVDRGVYTPGHPLRNTIESGVVHPTGMQSCFIFFFANVILTLTLTITTSHCYTISF